MKTAPTPTKAQEIELLQRLTVQAREANAQYLHEMLCSIAVPFENAIRSDFPGSMAANELIDTCRDARADMQKLNLYIRDAKEDLRKAQEETKDAKRETERAKNELAEIRQIARRLAAA